MRYLFLLLLFPALTLAQTKTPAAACTIPYFQYVVGTLAHDSMEGRLPGTKAEKISALFIENQFKKIGCTPLQKNTFQYPFSYRFPDSVTVQSAGNVCAQIDTKSDYKIVITAHYDHIGRGNYHSLDPFSHAIHNGADDNASGVAMLLGIASWCKAHQKNLNYDIVFVGFSGEEDGLFGSKYLLSQQLIDTSKIICNINFDMVGHLDKNRPMIELESALEYKAWDTLLPADTTKHFVVERGHNTIKDAADNYTFLQANIPAILISTGITAFYHRPDDDYSNINFDGMKAIGDYTLQLLQNLNKKTQLQLVLK